MRKPIRSLTEADFREAALWRFTLEEHPGEDETWVEPIAPGAGSLDLEEDLACIAIDLQLADGSTIFGLISAPSGQPELDAQTTTICAFVGGRRIDLAGYYDHMDVDRLAPNAFAAALSRTIEQVFPVTHDASRFFSGPPENWRGQVFERSPRPLNEQELLDLILGNP